MATKTKSKSKPKYSEEVRTVARATRELLGPAVKAPGPKQVAAVVSALGDKSPAKAAGLSLPKLKAWAGGERPDDYRQMGDLTKKVGDTWASGRKLAAILVSIEVVHKRKRRKIAMPPRSSRD